MPQETQKIARQPLDSDQNNSGDQGDASVQAGALRPVETALSPDEHSNKPSSDISMRTIHIGS